MTMQKKSYLIIVLFVVLVSGWYVFGNDRADLMGHVEFTRQGAKVVLNQPLEVKRIAVRSGSGQPILVENLGPGKHQNMPVFIPWEPGKPYVFDITLRNGKSVVFSLQSPEILPDKVSFLLQAPYGLDSDAGVGVVTNDSTFSVNMLLINHIDQSIKGNVDVMIPNEFEIVSIPANMAIEERDGIKHVIGKPQLTSENELWNEQIQLKTGQAGNKFAIKASLQMDNGQEQWTWDRLATIQVASVAEISSKIRVSSIDLPVDAAGHFDAKFRSGALAYKPPSRISHMLDAELDDRRFSEDPFTFVSIQVANDGDQQVLALVTGKVLDSVSGKLTPAFIVPPNKNGGVGYSYGITAIPPHSSNQLILPVYLDENNAIAGKYQLRAETKIFGVNEIVATSDKTVTLSIQDNQPVYITLGMTLFAVLGIGWFIWRQEKALISFSSKEMVIISLFGTVTFVTVNLPATIFMDIAHVIFGPFSFLFTGFFSQTVLYALMVALAVLLPRPGVISLMIIVRLILNGFIFGHFTPVGILLYAALAICLEIGLYFSGVTRKKDCQAVGSILWLAIVCGIVDIVTSYMSLMATMTLYRLFYADWYIGAVLVSGFIYTAIGAAIGCRLGYSLKRTAMD